MSPPRSMLIDGVTVEPAFLSRSSSGPEAWTLLERNVPVVLKPNGSIPSCIRRWDSTRCFVNFGDRLEDEDLGEQGTISSG